MRRALTAAAVLVLVPLLWLVTASAIYCSMLGRWGMFVFPYWQWAEAAPWWRFNWRVGLGVVTGAAGATMVLVLLVGAVISRSLRTTTTGRRPLYGDSQWASEAEQRKGGITQTRSLYRD